LKMGDPMDEYTTLSPLSTEDATVKLQKQMSTKTSQALKSQPIEPSSRPDGVPTKDNFSLATAELSPIRDGEILVRNQWMSVDPYMRGRIKEGDSYVPAFEIGEQGHEHV